MTIHPKASRARPFEKLASKDTERGNLLQAEWQAVPVLLADWYHDLSDTMYARYFRTEAFPSCVDSLLANGQGRVRCLPRDLLDCGPDLCGEAGIADKDTIATANASMDQAMSSMSAIVGDVDVLNADVLDANYVHIGYGAYAEPGWFPSNGAS